MMGFIFIVLPFQVNKKNTPRPYEDDGVPSRYHLNSPFSALCDRQSSVYAVTGIPVPVYSLAVSDWLLAFGFAKS
jgi:hypothetical protein